MIIKKFEYVVGSGSNYKPCLLTRYRIRVCESVYFTSKHSLVFHITVNHKIYICVCVGSSYERGLAHQALCSVPGVYHCYA